MYVSTTITVSVAKAIAFCRVTFVVVGLVKVIVVCLVPLPFYFVVISMVASIF